jgi:cobalt-zinc-cadmium resistance protein CzcA
MLTRIIDWSLRHRFLVIVLALLFIVGGGYAATSLPIDAFPDTTPVQVQVNTPAPALAPLEIEQQITLPVEQAIAGLPGLQEVRSISKFGLSQVTAIFKDGTNLYFARQLVGERISSVALPDGISRPEIGPASTGLGEVYHYLVSGRDHTLEELTAVQDWIIKPQLRSVPGVAEVNTWGGKRRQFQVRFDPVRLLKYDLTFDDLRTALHENNMNVGGGQLAQAGETFAVQGVSRTSGVDEIGNIVIASRGGVPIRVRDVAKVEEGHALRTGAVSADGEGEVVLGLGFMLMGENSHEVTRRLEQRVDGLRKGNTLPPGVEVKPVYARTEIVDWVIRTVRTNLFEGALLVVAVLFAFLGNIRAGLIVALAIPLSMLFAAQGMIRFGIAGSLMSLGAIDFGLIVDSSVIMVENSVRRLAQPQSSAASRLEVVREASLEVRGPTMFGELIIMIVYLPILTLEGVEGKLFRPMALTVIFALLGSMILSLTLMPVLASLLLPRKMRHGDNHLMRFLKRLYRPVVQECLRMRRVVLLAACAMLVFGAWLVTGTGSEFIPRLSEMAVVINTVRLAGVSLDESTRYGSRLEMLIRDRFPDEVRDIWTRTGTAEVATDPMGIEVSDVFITLQPREQWKQARSQDELVARMDEALEGMPGMRAVFSQPIEMRVNEMVAGIRADLGVKLFGDDLDVLKAKAAEVEEVLKAMPGSSDLYTEQITGQPVLEVRVDQAAIARYGVPAQHVLEIVEALGGVKVGDIRQGQRRFDLVIKLADEYQRDPASLGRVLVPTAGGEHIPLGRLARIRQTEGPSTISHEWGKRRIVVQCNVRGRDVGGFVAEARSAIERNVELPPGYHVQFGGQFEHLERARTRLAVVVPIALGLIFLLLYMTYGRFADVVRIFLTLPLSAVGGLIALHLRGMPFTISAGVGFVAMLGVAVLGDMVFVSYLRGLLGKGCPVFAAIEETALTRLRPVLTTGLVASLGFLPMALSTGIGAEVQRPLATVVIGGVVTSTLLTLVVLPAIYSFLPSPATARKESPAPAAGLPSAVPH